MIDKNTMSVEDARERFLSLVGQGWSQNLYELIIKDLGTLMARSPEMERAIIAYLLAVRKQEESKDGV